MGSENIEKKAGTSDNEGNWVPLSKMSEGNLNKSVDFADFIGATTREAFEEISHFSEEQTLDLLAVADMVSSGNPLVLNVATSVVNEGFIKGEKMTPWMAWVKYGHEYRELMGEEYSAALREAMKKNPNSRK